MGVTIEVWRIRIGTLASPASSCSSSDCTSVPFNWTLQPNMFSLLDSCFFKLFVLAILLLIGNVELNPGPYPCPSPGCGVITSTYMDNLFHQNLHSREKNFFFRCPHSACKLCVKTYSGLLNHAKQFHKTLLSTDDSSININEGASTSTAEVAVHIQCQVESCLLSFPSIKDVCHHYLNHIIKQNQTVPCPLVKKCCSSTKFSVAQNLRSHLSINHQGWKDSSLPLEQVVLTSSSEVSKQRGNQNPSEVFSEAMDITEAACDDDNLSSLPDTSAIDNPTFTSDMFFKYLAKFYLMLEAELCLPESTVQSIAEGLQLISELIQYQTSETLSRVLKEKDIPKEDTDFIKNQVSLADVFYAAHHKDSPGPTLSSSHFRSKYFEKNFPCVSPVAYSLDKDKIDGESIQFISVKETLELLFQDTSVQEEITESFNRSHDPDFISDYTDGSVCRSRSSYGKERIDILLYQDGFGLVNPLGSAKKKHKLNATYWTLGNFKAHNRSKVDSLFLALLVEERLLSDREYYGPLKCFSPLLTELKKLETEGVVFMGKTIPVVLQFVLGDNLGSHMLGGFIESFSGKYFCRFCEITRSEFHEAPNTVKVFRTVQDYKDALRKLSSIQEENPNIVSYKGVKMDSPLNEVNGDFHVCDPGLPVCLAHDLFLGVVDWDLAEIIANFVQEGWFSYKSLNRLIANFKCEGSDIGNKPALVKDTGNRLGGHAVQNWTLLRLLPFILQDKIKDPRNQMWQLYLTLKSAVEYTCAPAFSANDVNNLKKMANKYIEDRCKLLKKKVKPKHHFFLHYADLVPLIGPLIHMFTLRFESKHQFFKNAARVCHNFINLCYTLAQRYQLYLSYLKTGFLLPKGLQQMRTSVLEKEKYTMPIRRVIDQEKFGKGAMDSPSIALDGMMFKKGMFIILKKSSPALLDVGHINIIVTEGSSVFFIVEVFQAKLLKDYGVYELHSKAEYISVKFTDLKKVHFVQVYDFRNESCFSLKHTVCL